MTIDDLYLLVEEIEEENKYLFVVYDKGLEIGIDVLDYDDEEEVDGGWFKSVDEAYHFISEYKGSL